MQISKTFKNFAIAFNMDNNGKITRCETNMRPETAKNNFSQDKF